MFLGWLAQQTRRVGLLHNAIILSAECRVLNIAQAVWLSSSLIQCDFLPNVFHCAERVGSAMSKINL